MVYKDCPLGLTTEQRGRGCTTEFYIDEKPQIYCYGREADDGTMRECVTCPNWALGEKCEEDFQKAKANGFKSQGFHSDYKQGTKEYMHDYYEQVIKPRRQARKRGVNV
jgi:hypothetical protein